MPTSSSGDSIIDSADIQPVGLTAELLREIFPIARSDRRIHRDIFKDLLSEEDAKKDALFYPALLSRIRSDTTFLRQLNERFLFSDIERDKRKSFAIRAVRWLDQRVGPDISVEDLLTLDADHFPQFSAERELLRLFQEQAAHGKPYNAEMPSKPPIEAAEGPTWSAIREKLRTSLDQLERPDLARADEIVLLAETLRDACIVADTIAIEALELDRFRQEIADRLAPLAMHESGDALIRQVTIASMEDLQAITSQIEGLMSLNESLAKATAEFAEKNAAYDAAVAGRERDRALVKDLILRADESEAAYKQAKADLEEAVLKVLGPLKAIGSPPDDSDVSSQGAVPPQTTIADNTPGEHHEGDWPQSAPPASEAIEPAPPYSADSEVAQVVVSIDPANETKENEPGTTLPTWDGEQSLDQLLASYLNAGEYSFAYYLATLAEEARFSSPLPPAVLKALAVTPLVSGPWDGSAQRIGEILADAMSAVTAAEASDDQNRIDHIRALIFSALLRPALLAPATTARQHLANLPMRGGFAIYRNLQMALCELVHGFQPTIVELGELAGAERKHRLPAAEKSLREWLAKARSRQTLHAPTHLILHQLLAPQGSLGETAEAALARLPGTAAKVGEILATLANNRSAQEKLISDAEQAVGRHRRDRIRGMALDWACRHIQAYCECLQDWHAAVEADHSSLDDKQKSILLRQIGPVKRAVTELEAVTYGSGHGIEGSIAVVVQKSVEALRTLVHGRHSNFLRYRLDDALDLPLLRLPGGCQYYGLDDPAYGEEREGQQKRLFDALKNPQLISANEAAAFESRQSEHAVLAARRLFDLLCERGTLAGKDKEAAEQSLTETESAGLQDARKQVEALRLGLATLYNLDLSTGDEVRQSLDRLDSIAAALNPADPGHEQVRLPARDGQRSPDIPPDFPELDLLLEDIRLFRDAVRDRVANGQRIRLSRLIEERPEQASIARDLSKALRERDPVTVEDQIAQLQAGLPLSDIDSSDDDVFKVFFPAFVDHLTNVEDDSLNRGRVETAMRNATASGPLSFRGLDVDAQRSSSQLLQRWWQNENAMNRPASELREVLRQLMESLGFTSVSIVGDSQLIPGRLRRFQIRTDPLVAERWFLPPVFGSEAGGSYPAFLAKSDIQDDVLATELGKAGRESPCLLFVFGRLGRQRRESFARRMWRDKQSVLLVDEAQILFLATDGADRLQRLFTCAAPFGYLQPYTTSAGNIPREMFFGRAEEIEKIVSRQSGGCLVYGGRQLGKSALLHHVRKLHDKPSLGSRAFYLKIDVIGAHGTPAERIWAEIGAVLAAEGIFDKGQPKPDSLIADIRSWIGADAARRLLILLDETDAFLAAESRTGFPNLGRLKDLMEETGRRFKVVFAGLHNVRRLSQAPNSPLVHLGDPICIGPLNTTADSSAAARMLVTAPMRAAGFDYERPELAWDILARVNHYPSLVQVFCKALLEGLSNSAKPVGKGPRYILERRQIFESSSAQGINRQIRDRFQWTLNLDPRYELIAKVLGLYRLEKPNGDAAVLRSGLTSDEIAEEANAWWPTGIDRLGFEDFQSFLEEMVDLGVLARYGSQRDRFGLRSAQVAQMLGRKEDISDQIMRIRFKEPQVDYDAVQFHRRVVVSDPSRRSPLADRALAELFDAKSPGIRILVAAPALWGSDIADRLRDLSAGWPDGNSGLAAELHHGPMQKLRPLLERNSSMRTVLIMTDPSALDSVSLNWLSQQPKVKSSDILPILMAPPNWLTHHRMVTASQSPARVFVPRMWGEAMLRAWLEERDLRSLDERPLRELILTGTGGAPELVEAAYPMLERLAAGRTDVQTELTIWSADQKVLPDAAGLSPEQSGFFRDLSQLVGSGTEEASTVEELLSAEGTLNGAEVIRLLGLFAELGLLHAQDPSRQGVALSRLGKLVAHGTAE